MSRYYFNPGCALSLYKPEMEHRLLRLLHTHNIPARLHNTCCHHEPGVGPDAIIINVCAGCDRRFRSLYEGVSTVSLWEVLDGLHALNTTWPDHSGLTLTVHDPCPMRERPSVHEAVRSLLRKMRIQIVEAEAHGAHSVCCGDSFYPALPVAAVHELMKKRAASLPCDTVCVCCVSCIKSMHIGGKTPRYLLDLLLHEPTEAQVYDTVEWHAQVKAYRECH